MEILYLVFALVSIVIITDGMLLKTGQLQKLMVQLIKKKNTDGIVSLLSSFLVYTGVIALMWTAVGYIWSEELPLEVFILIYVAVILISGILLFAVLKRR